MFGYNPYIMPVVLVGANIAVTHIDFFLLRQVSGYFVVKRLKFITVKWQVYFTPPYLIFGNTVANDETVLW